MKERTHCKNGHEANEANTVTRIHTGSPPYAYKQCQVCCRERAAVHYKKNKKEILEFAAETRRMISGKRKMGKPRIKKPLERTTHAETRT